MSMIGRNPDGTWTDDDGTIKQLLERAAEGFDLTGRFLERLDMDAETRIANGERLQAISREMRTGLTMLNVGQKPAEDETA